MRPALVSCLFMTAATAQSAAQPTERLLPQWLTGITAVCIFLFLAFVTLLVKKAWCESSGEKTAGDSTTAMINGNACDSILDMVRSKEDKNAYENLVTDAADQRVTAM